MTVEILQAKIQLLENENRRLKEKLEEAGISYNDIENYALDSNSALYDPDQGGRIKPIDVTNKVAKHSLNFFAGVEEMCMICATQIQRLVEMGIILNA